MNIQEQLTILKNNLNEVEKQCLSLEGGRRASAAKARASLMKVKNGSHTLRKSVMEHSKTIPVKARKLKAPSEPEPEPVAPTEVVEPVEPKIKAPRAPRKKKV